MKHKSPVGWCGVWGINSLDLITFDIANYSARPCSTNSGDLHPFASEKKRAISAPEKAQKHIGIHQLDFK